jgi:hypothetical protein
LAFQLDGLPEGAVTRCEVTEVTIESPNGERWSNRVTSLASAGRYVPFVCQAQVAVPSALIESETGRAVRVHAALYLTIFGPERTTDVAVGNPPVAVEGVGFCAAVADELWGVITCRNALRPFRGMAPATGSMDPSYSPFAADLRVNPVYGSAGLLSKGLTRRTLTVREPVAHVRVMVDERDVSLRAFAAE